MVLRRTETEILFKANQKLESDLSDLAIKLKNCDVGHLAWMQTYYSLRLDDLEGLIKEYFLNETQLNRKINYPKRTFRYFFAPLSIIWPIIKSFFIKQKEIPVNSIWFSSAKSIKRHRYRSLLGNIVKDKKVFFTHTHSHAVKTNQSDYSLNFVYFFKFLDLIKAFRMTLKIKKALKNVNDSTIAYYWVKELPWTHFWNMALRELMVNRAIVKLKPKAIFFATANTYSPSRLMSRLAKKHSVPYIVVACRPFFSPLRPEERLCRADLEEIHDARVADFFIVWDEFSIKTLKSNGVQHEKIFLLQEENSKSITELLLKDRFILFLTHETELNESMINTWVTAASSANLKEIVIRTHPICKLTTSQHDILDQFDLIDCSDIPMSRIQFENCIAVSINSTAAIEASSRGCGVLWIPYLNQRSVILKPAMDLIGIIADDDNDLIAKLFDLNDFGARLRVISDSIEAYKRNFIGTSDMSSLLINLNIN